MTSSESPPRTPPSKQRVRQLSGDNHPLDGQLKAARSNLRFQDRRIADLQARLTESGHPHLSINRQSQLPTGPFDGADLESDRLELLEPADDLVEQRHRGQPFCAGCAAAECTGQTMRRSGDLGDRLLVASNLLNDSLVNEGVGDSKPVDDHLHPVDKLQVFVVATKRVDLLGRTPQQEEPAGVCTGGG